MEKDIFTFDDFIKKPKGLVEELKPSDKLLEEIKQELEEEKDDSVIDDFICDEEEPQQEAEEQQEEEIEVKEEVKEEESYYKLYKDKNEEFICDISIEGANPNDTEARIVIESKDWTLMFKGELKNGKCKVPIKKLNILEEGQEGNIRLEVIAEGNLFIPWEDKFKVKMSKKVTVKVNEQKETKKTENNGIKVKVKK